MTPPMKPGIIKSFRTITIKQLMPSMIPNDPYIISIFSNTTNAINENANPRITELLCITDFMLGLLIVEYPRPKENAYMVDVNAERPVTKITSSIPNPILSARSKRNTGSQ